MKIAIEDINSIGIQAQAKRDGITHVRWIGSNGITGDHGLTAYWCGNTRVIDTNADPLWEESDPEAFALAMAEIEGIDL
jgi:hypothetical protein